ncbi:ketopantoate reductase family protein [Halomarina pelagica]|uniref:ketopantoate reductase family protein n=1 Tax=Halomarina pelagica TaxID=2961599 RepID=UPI0020C22233|nr:ketopantoate reductase family protein [Halomarina sp. BND7]
MDVVVFGAGSLGSLVGGLLAREHRVTLVGRDPHVQRVRDAGLRIEGAVEASVSPAADTSPPRRADLAVVTVKAFDTDDAGRALAACDLGGALSLQNGLGNEETLAEHLDAPVLAGTCTYGARLLESGRVECTGVGEIVLGPREGGRSALADRVGKAFERAGLVTVVADDMPRRQWEKLAVNAGINAPTALARIPNGALLDGPAREAMRTAAREVARAARRRGVDLADETAVASVERVAADTAGNASSMLQDVERGRRTEVDHINGVVAGVDAPVNATLAALVRAWERERGLR